MTAASISRPLAAGLAAVFAFGSGPIRSQGLTDYKPGEGASRITGSASGSDATDAAPTLEQCAAPLGAMTVGEPLDFTQNVLLKFNFSLPTGLIRLIIQQLKCLQVADARSGLPSESVAAANERRGASGTCTCRKAGCRSHTRA